MAGMSLHEAVQAHLHSIAIKDSLAPATVKRRKTTLDQLQTEVGTTIQPKNITENHLDALYERLALTNNPASLNLCRSHLNSFFGWCRQRKITPATHHPSVRKAWKVLRTKKLIVDVDEFEDLLEAAQTPRDRMVISLGLYLFLRASEVQSIRLKDVDLEAGNIDVTVWKTKQRDTMPISEELDAELRAWLTYYTEQVGVLKPDYYLVPSRHLSGIVYDPETQRLAVREESIETLRPERRLARPAVIVGRALREIGYPAIDSTSGETTRQGVHVLRRSGARALFDHLRDEGYDGALQRVRVMLHHASVEMTELYLGLELEAKLRNEAFCGKPMFPNARRKATVTNIADKQAT